MPAVAVAVADPTGAGNAYPAPGCMSRLRGHTGATAYPLPRATLARVRMRCAYNVHMRMHVHTGCLPPVAVVAACWLPPALIRP